MNPAGILTLMTCSRKTAHAESVTTSVLPAFRPKYKRSVTTGSVLGDWMAGAHERAATTNGRQTSFKRVLGGDKMRVLNQPDDIAERIRHCSNANTLANILNRRPDRGAGVFEVVERGVGVRHPPVRN